MTKQSYIINGLLIAAVLANALVWFGVRDWQARWLGVPPAPSNLGSVGLGDSQLAYRSLGIVLQNMGDVGGRYTPLRLYDYDALTDWFLVMDTLDPKSNFAPYLAAYYFSSVPDTQKLVPLIGYLQKVGLRDGGDNWRWLAEAIFLAKYKLKDMEKASAMAEQLSDIAKSRDDLPVWAYNMKAYILNDMGQKQAAYTMLMGVLATSADKLDPAEVNSTIAYICEQVLNKQQAAANKMCQNKDF